MWTNDEFIAQYTFTSWIHQHRESNLENGFSLPSVLQPDTRVLFHILKFGRFLLKKQFLLLNNLWSQWVSSSSSPAYSSFLLQVFACEMKFISPGLLRNAIWKYELILMINDRNNRNIQKDFIHLHRKTWRKWLLDNLPLSSQKQRFKTDQLVDPCGM